MKKIKILIAPILVVVIALFAIQANAQSSNKKKDHADERFDADAAAVAYINCKYEIAKYYTESKPDDQIYQKEFKEVGLMQLQINLQVGGKYRVPSDTFDKFSKKVKSYQKDLATCIKYQNIIDANQKLLELKTQ